MEVGKAAISQGAEVVFYASVASINTSHTGFVFCV